MRPRAPQIKRVVSASRRRVRLNSTYGCASAMSPRSGVTGGGMTEIAVRCSSVSVVAVRHGALDAEVLLLRRTRSLRGEWCQVAGAIEPAERAWQAGLRELYEETGLRPDRFFSGDICEQFYEAHLDAISILPVFVAYIDPSAEVGLNAEHSEYRWATFEEAIQMVPFAGQRHLLRHVEAEFLRREPSMHLEIRVD